jgi:peptide-methionine (S)-S-oxide reductase
VKQIGFGGGCHWCTEAVFESLCGVKRVQQGWISSTHSSAKEFSEAIIVDFDENIPLDILIEIHLHTHNSTSNHSLRDKYRSAIYTFSKEQEKEAKEILKKKQLLFDKPLITKVYPFEKFKLNDEKYLHYYKNNPQKPFCKSYIEPKLQLLLKRYSNFLSL